MNGHAANVPSLHRGNELAEIDGFGLYLRPIEEIKQQDHHQTDDEPKSNISIEGVQERSLKLNIDMQVIKLINYCTGYLDFQLLSSW
jgi:hypothetical protein